MARFKEYWTVGPQHKQRVNLSGDAYGVLMMDMDDYGVSGSRSDFVNRVVDYYLDLEAEDLPAYDEEASSGEAFNITLQEDILSELMGSRKVMLAEKYHSIGAFIKACMESYAAKRNCDREKVYFGRMAEDLKSCRENHKAVVLENSEGKFLVRIDRICVDPHLQYNYVIGYSRPYTCVQKINEAEEKPASFRLSRIKEDFKPSKAISGRITKEEQKRIEQRLREVSPAFFKDDPVDITVKMTEQGKKDYERILHLRPKLISKEGDLYRFRCSERQARYYFVRFFGDAVIVSPESLAKMMKRKFDAAAAAY